MRRLITLIATTLTSAAAFAAIPTVDNGGTAPAAAPHQGSFTPFIFLAILFVVFYFFLIRPQQKRNRAQKQMISELSAGAEVATMGGILGKVTKVEETTVDLEIAKGVTVTFQKQAIGNQLPKGTVKHA